MSACSLKSDGVSYKKIKFGRQDKTPIFWYIVSQNEDSQILLSEKILDVQLYNKENVDIDFEKSSVFDYLNTEFVNICFTKDEIKKMIFIDDDNTLVALPSLNDLKEIFGDISFLKDGYYNDMTFYQANTKMVAEPAELALYNEIEVFDNETYATIMGQKEIDKRYSFANGKSAYWTKNKNDEKGTMYFVTATGYIDSFEPNRDYIGIRPMIKIKK